MAISDVEKFVVRDVKNSFDNLYICRSGLNFDQENTAHVDV